MDAAAVCKMLFCAGVSLEAQEERLIAAPASVLNDELRGLIRQHKPELLKFLHEAECTTADVIEAALRACHHFGDGPEACEQMRRDVLETPLHLRSDLQAHLQATYRNGK